MFVPIYNLLETLQLGDPQDSGPLVVVPILNATPTKRTYISLSEALAAGSLTVGEVSKRGSVPELFVRNHGDEPVLMIDGEELVGAKQNRVLNASILVAAHGKLVVPVSCTEAGRWSFQTATFGDSGEVASSSVRQMKTTTVTDNLRESGSYHSDQGMIWHKIDVLQERTRVASPSSAMRDVYHARHKEIGDRLSFFPRIENQSGVVVLVDGKVRGLDFLSDPDTYAFVHEKLIRSYVVDIVDRQKPRSVPVAEGRVNLDIFLSDLKSADETTHDSPGLGSDHRLQGKRSLGSALVWENTVIHFVAFPGETPPPEPRKERMAGWWQRRQRRS